MKLKLLGLIACMALLGVAQAEAATLVGQSTDVSGIDGLVVDGVSYNVSFEQVNYGSVPGLNPSTFYGNPSGAFDASSALISALNSFGVSGLVDIRGNLVGYEALVVPIVVNDFGLAVVGAECISNSSGCLPSPSPFPVWFQVTTALPDNGMAIFPSDQEFDFAVFSAATPLPAALPLFATGLGVMGLLGWRRKHRKAGTGNKPRCKVCIKLG
jgi:hypothetical protein